MVPTTVARTHGRSRRFTLAAALIASMLASACTGTAGQASLASSPDSGAAGPSSSASPTRPSKVPANSPDASGATAPTNPRLDQAWATASLVNVTTGEPFRIADLHASGKVVFVETMAIWCSNCKAQQAEAMVAFEELDPTRAEWVVIDVESSETAEALARYREQHGFPFSYAIADADFARALVGDFGDVVLSPPSVNIIVIGTDGRITHLRGHKSADELRHLAADSGA